MQKKLVEEFILSQFERQVAQDELSAFDENTNIDWVSRTRATIDEFLVDACDLAEYIEKKVPERLNSPIYIEELFEKNIQKLTSTVQDEAWIKQIRQYISTNRELSSNLESQQVSAEIQREVAKFAQYNGKMYSNGNSIFPDFLYHDRDYLELPFQDRKKTVHGPCLQGKKNPRPSNVPDGIELKTNRSNRMRIDAHAPHIGLHLGFTWDAEPDGRILINGAWLGYITESDHAESARNSKTTTVKYSFGHNKFISLLSN